VAWASCGTLAVLKTRRGEESPWNHGHASAHLRRDARATSSFFDITRTASEGVSPFIPNNAVDMALP